MVSTYWTHFWRKNSNIWKISNANSTNSTKKVSNAKKSFKSFWRENSNSCCVLTFDRNCKIEKRQTWHWSPLISLFTIYPAFFASALQERRWNQETYETHRASFDNFDGSRVSNQSQFVPTVFYQPGIWIQRSRIQRKVISITFNSQLAISCLIWHIPDNTPLSYFLC